MPAPRPLIVRDLGRADYAGTLAAQLDLVARRARGEIDDHLLLVEHDSVLTIGRGADRDAVAGLALPVHEVSRGGEATWHGPGQLVGYPILALQGGERDLHRYLRDLEEVLILTCLDLGVAAGRNPPHTGVWIGAKKVASIGVAVRQWVTYHGFALNVDCDLAAFRGFDPCGLSSAVMTSLAAESGIGCRRGEVVARLVARFAARFERIVTRES
jgi:lipoyl(octanoyl) transferase